MKSKEQARWQLLRTDEDGQLQLLGHFTKDSDVTDYVNETRGTDTADLVVKSMVTGMTYRYEDSQI
jgi:hypothetical protein